MNKFDRFYDSTPLQALVLVLGGTAERVLRNMLEDSPFMDSMKPEDDVGILLHTSSKTPRQYLQEACESEVLRVRQDVPAVICALQKFTRLAERYADYRESRNFRDPYVAKLQMRCFFWTRDIASFEEKLKENPPTQ